MILLLLAGPSSSDHVREHVARTGPKALEPRTSVRPPAKGIGLTTEVGVLARLNQRTLTCVVTTPQVVAMQGQLFISPE